MIYPHSYTQFLKSGRTEDELMEILESVHLAYLPSREGGWATKKEWRDVLSGGEKQRVGYSCILGENGKLIWSGAILDGFGKSDVPPTKIRVAGRYVQTIYLS